MAALTAGVLGSWSRLGKHPGQLQCSQRVSNFRPSWGTLLEPLQLGCILLLPPAETSGLELATVTLAQGVQEEGPTQEWRECIFPGLRL